MNFLVRFTRNIDEKSSYDDFSQAKFEGLCCFEIEVDDCDSEDFSAAVREIADKNSNYAEFYDGNYIVFDGVISDENTYGNGVISSIDTIYSRGNLELGKFGYKVKYSFTCI